MTAIIITSIICVSIVLIVWIVTIHSGEPKKEEVFYAGGRLEEGPRAGIIDSDFHEPKYEDLWRITIMDEEVIVVQNRNTSYIRKYLRMKG